MPELPNTTGIHPGPLQTAFEYFPSSPPTSTVAAAVAGVAVGAGVGAAAAFFIGSSSPRTSSGAMPFIQLLGKSWR
jgi:hypothetical protein